MDDEVARLRERSEAALERIDTAGKQTKDDWWLVGEFMVALINQTLNETGLNTPNGKTWAKAFGAKLRECPRLAKIPASTRTALRFCMEHREAVDDWLSTEDLCQLNHPVAIARRFKKEMLEPDKEERTTPTRMELQQAATLELQEQLDQIRKTLGVQTTEEAVFEVGRLMTDGVVMHGYSDPEVQHRIDDLERQLDKATTGLSNTLGELEKNKAQQARQAETITALTERVKQAATMLQVVAETVRQYDDPDEVWPDGLPADLERWLAYPVSDHYSDSLKSNNEPAEPPPAETIAEPPPKKKRGRPPRDRSNDPPSPSKRPRGRPRKDRTTGTVLNAQETAEANK